MTPDGHTIQEHYIPVGNGHELYVQDWGNKATKMPIIHLHGGPGSSTSDRKKRQFDPARQRVVFFDQRGSGRSLPYGSLEHNTTQDLIQDISTIADALQIKKFVLRGGSWGSTLALAYGIAHPDRVHAMVLDGIWTASKQELAWLDDGVFRTFFPDAWQDYLNLTPKKHHDNPTKYHRERMTDSTDQTGAVESAYAFHSLEGAVLTLNSTIYPEPLADFDPVGSMIENHYIAHHCFMPDRYIMDNANKLTMPLYLVQGRYDMVCPPAAAYELASLAPDAELIMTTSGHATERESTTVISALLKELTK